MKTRESLALAYDDVLLVPKYSEVLPHEVDLKTYFSKRISLSIPVASSAMDTVTESTAIVMAQEGGIGVIHKNLSIRDQVKEVVKVKKFEAGVVDEPICINGEDKLIDVIKKIERFNFSGFPVVEETGLLLGIITNRDMRYEENLELPVKELMTPFEKLVVAQEGISSKDAKEILKKNKIEKLPIVNKNQILQGLITIKDLEKSLIYPQSNKDDSGRLRVAAAVGVGEKEFERAQGLIEAHCDAIVIDTAHGHSKAVIEMVKRIKKEFPQVDVVAGNVATEEACLELIKAGADGIKVGIGPGSICTTRIVAGIGVPQLQALMDCSKICKQHKVPFIADGGIKFSGDIVKALAVGASTVMIGSLFAGTDETPGERIIYQGRAYKVYRGMGSLAAMMLGSKDRYGQASVLEEKKLVAEGIEGQVPYRGPLAENVFQLVGGIRSGMGYTGSKNLECLYENAEFLRLTAAGLKESHPHEVTITKEAPNYRP